MGIILAIVAFLVSPIQEQLFHSSIMHRLFFVEDKGKDEEKKVEEVVSSS